MRLRLLPSWPLLVALGLLATQGATRVVEASDLGSRVDALFAEQRRSDAPGGVVTVIHDGRIVHETAFGMADLERGVAVSPDSVFEIGSISKQFTAMCVLLLELDGKLDLDDDVRKYVPELPEYERTITLRHLIHHTSGIRDVETLIPLAGLPWVNYVSPEKLLELVTRQRGLNFAPGDQYLYSNSGYQLLATVVERVSDQSLRAFAEERIFRPLGMKRTQFWDHPRQVVAHRAIAYSRDADGEYGNELWNLPFAGPAGLYTSARDLALWDANFYGNRLGGGAELIDRMEAPGWLANREPIEYAAGLVVARHRGQRLIRHGGAWMGYRASLLRFPELRLTIVALSNAASGLGSMRVADLYLDHLLGGADDAEAAATDPFEPPAGVGVTLEELVAFEGRYWNESDALLRGIEVRDDELHYVRGPKNSSALAAIGNGRFVMIGPAVRVDVSFEAGGAGGQTMIVEVDGQEPLGFERLDPSSGADLAALEGSYWSAELERELRVRVGNGGFEVSWADEERWLPAERIGAEELLVQQFVPVPWYEQDVRLRVQRAPSGQIEGLVLSCDMVRGVSLEKSG